MDSARQGWGGQSKGSIPISGRCVACSEIRTAGLLRVPRLGRGPPRTQKGRFTGPVGHASPRRVGLVLWLSGCPGRFARPWADSSLASLSPGILRLSLSRLKASPADVGWREQKPGGLHTVLKSREGEQSRFQFSSIGVIPMAWTQSERRWRVTVQVHVLTVAPDRPGRSCRDSHISRV